MEQEFIDWFREQEVIFHQSQFDDKQIAYSAWLEGKKQALQQNKDCEHRDTAMMNQCLDCGKWLL